MAQTEQPVETCKLHVPPLNELADVIRHGLRSEFIDVEVDVVDCPDLTQPPFHLAAPGTHIMILIFH